MRFVVPVLLLALASPAFAQVDTGEADFSSYVALGDSLTFGVVSGSLAAAGQESSYPLQIARGVGVGGSFEQPVVSEPGLPGRLILNSFSPIDFDRLSGIGIPINVSLERPYNNLGVSGASANDTLSRSGGNLQHDLVLRGAAPALFQALALQPTFATVWIGNNDVLAAAVGGIVIEGETLTSVDSFTSDYFTIVGALSASGADIALANIPSVTALPFVTTLAPVVADVSSQEPVLVNGQPVPLIGPDGPLASGDRVLLSALGELADGRGVPVSLGGTGAALGNEHVLNLAEQAAIEARTAELNDVISTAALLNRTALVDIARVFDDARDDGIGIAGVNYDLSLFGGLFSYDGIHPSPTGYGVVAEAFVTAINASFGAAIPVPDLSGILFGPDGDLGPRGVPVAQLSSKRFMNDLNDLLGLESAKKLKRLVRKAKRRERRQTAGG